MTTPASSTAASPADPTTPSGSASKAQTSPGKKSSIKRSAKPSASKKKTGPRRPSAIPQRLLSSTSTTPSKPSVAIPETPTQVKVELENLSPASSSIPPAEVTNISTPSQNDGEETPGTGKRPIKWMRVKKPLKELLQKIMVEIRKKDDYALFEEPGQSSQTSTNM